MLLYDCWNADKIQYGGTITVSSNGGFNNLCGHHLKRRYVTFHGIRVNCAKSHVPATKVSIIWKTRPIYLSEVEVLSLGNNNYCNYYLLLLLLISSSFSGQFASFYSMVTHSDSVMHDLSIFIALNHGTIFGTLLVLGPGIPQNNAMIHVGCFDRLSELTESSTSVLMPCLKFCSRDDKPLAGIKVSFTFNICNLFFMYSWDLVVLLY